MRNTNSNSINANKFASSSSKAITGYLWVVLICTGFVSASSTNAQAQFLDEAAQQAVMATPLQKSHAAIDQCRAQRLRGQITTYKDSALCSNPQIFAAWQEAKYPHMDLITVWLNARLAGSERVDQNLVTQGDFERQMAELTNRLTLEERKRTSNPNSNNVQDAVIQPQQPSSQSFVVGLVALQSTEPEVTIPDNRVAEVRPDNKSRRNVNPFPAPIRAATREQSASRTVATTAQPSRSDVVPGAQASTSLPTDRFALNAGRSNEPSNSFLVSQRNSTAAPRSETSDERVGRGGPYVPAVYVQVSANRSEADAQAAYAALQGQFPTILASRQAIIRRADLGSKGTFYRAQIGPISAEKADRVCNKLKAAGGDCFIQTN